MNTETAAAISAAEAAYNVAVAKISAIQFSNLATWVPVNLLTGAVAPHRARISAGIRQISYATATAAVTDSLYAAVATAANEMAELCGQISDPRSMRDVLGRLYRETTGNLMQCPFRLSDPNVFAGPQQPTPAARAFDTLRRFRERGIQVNRVGDSLQLLGVVHDGDLADAAELKSELLKLLPVPVTV